MEVSRDFKGIWIPREIFLDERISPLEKLLWADIHSLYDRSKGGCYASNEYLAKKYKVSERYIRIMISNLKKIGVVLDVDFDGRTRVIKAILPPEDLSDRNYSSGQSGTDQTGTIVPPLEEQKFLPSPETHTYIEKKAKRKDYVPSADASELAAFLHMKILSIKPNYKQPNLQSWAKSIDLMITQDNRSIEEIRIIIAWLPTSPFWSKNVLSADKLREKFDRLQLDMADIKKPTSSQSRQEINKEKVEKRFKSRQKYNGAECIITDIAISFTRGSTHYQLNFKEQGFDSQFDSILRKLGIV